MQIVKADYLRNLLHAAKVNINIPEQRQNVFDYHVVDKLQYLINNDDIADISILPDFCNDKLALSGVVIESSERVYPAAIGWDPGCGFRVLHISKSYDELKFIVDKIKLIETYISYKKYITNLCDDDIRNIITDPINWCVDRGIMVEGDIPRYHEIIDGKAYKSELNFDQIRSCFGGIATGNHFIEFRYVSEINDEQYAKALNVKKDDVIVLIHSGAGVGFERTFMKHFAKAYAHSKCDEKLTAYFNGYKVCFNRNSKDAMSYLNDCMYAENFAIANRQILTYFLRKEIDEGFKVLLDEEHDHIDYRSSKIICRKGVQRYCEHAGIPIAILPGTITDPAYLLYGTGKYKYINHGVGEGADGELTRDFRKVITNLQVPLDRKYYSTEHVLTNVERSNWAKTILKMEPWISIKNLGGENG